MVKYTDKKWLILQHVWGGQWEVPDANIPWTNDCNIALGKLLRSPANHFANDNIDMNADIYFMIIVGTDYYKEEIALIKKLKANGAKVIIGFSSDMRFLTGEGLLGPTGINYTDLCREADVVVSGLPAHLKVFGRYQHKVIDYGVCLERVNFSKPYEERDIDILMSGSIFRNEPTLSFGLELMAMLKEKYPDKRIVYPTKYRKLLQPKYPQIEFLDADDYMYNTGLVPLLQRSKIYINPEARPNPGRAMIESFYCRTPYICSTLSYASKYYPNYTYDYLNFDNIVDLYGKFLEADRAEIIKKSEELAEEDYFDNAIKVWMEKLYG